MEETKWLLQELEQTMNNLKEVVGELLLSEKEVQVLCAQPQFMYAPHSKMYR
jgi:anion-transporting  ArsA/GET3 family ATPase